MTSSWDAVLAHSCSSCSRDYVMYVRLQRSAADRLTASLSHDILVTYCHPGVDMKRMVLSDGRVYTNHHHPLLVLIIIIIIIIIIIMTTTTTITRSPAVVEEANRTAFVYCPVFNTNNTA